MAKELTLKLPEDLKEYVDLQIGAAADSYQAASDYICDLIRRDMQDRAAVKDILQGLREVERGEFVEESILDILYED